MKSTAAFSAIIAWTCFFADNPHCAEGLLGGRQGRRLNGRLLRKLKGEEEEPTTTTTTARPHPTSVQGVIAQDCGSNVRVVKYDNSYYKGSNGGPVKEGDDLECNFNGICCWDNVKHPTDQFDWSWATGNPDAQKWRENFGNQRKPTGRYLIAARTKSSATDEAMWLSCTIACTTRPIKVHFKHWTTQGVQLQVCSSDTFFNENNKVQLLNCKDVRRSESPGPSTIEIPPGEYIDIIIVASNFQNSYGGVAIIDDITVDIVPCHNAPVNITKSPA